jgi:hypothetical protein
MNSRMKGMLFSFFLFRSVKDTIVRRRLDRRELRAPKGINYDFFSHEEVGFSRANKVNRLQIPPQN